MSIADKLQIIAENEQKVYDAGKADGVKSEYDRFWDVFQNYGDEQGVPYGESFGKEKFTDENYYPKYPIYVAQGVNSGYALFNGAGNISDIKVPIYHRGTNMGYLFTGCRKLKRIPAFHILADATGFQSAFYSCVALETLNIYGTIAINGFNVSWSTKLTHDSLMSIINALADKSEDTSGTVWTVTLGEANINKLSDEEKNIAVQKGWVLG